MLELVAAFICLTTLLTYVNYRFIGLPPAIGVMTRNQAPAEASSAPTECPRPPAGSLPCWRENCTRMRRLRSA